MVGCGTNSLKLGSKSNYEIDNGTVRLKINNESITNTGAKMQLINYTGENYEYGSEFSIEYQKNGTWYSIIPKEDMNFNMMAYLLEDNTTKELDINWENFYGKLPNGKYRIIKNFSKEKNRSEDVYVSAEFVIE